MDVNSVREMLSSGLENADIEIQSDGNKLMLHIVSESFVDLSKVKRQQLVYKLLGEKISSGEIHAVTMKTSTPAEIAGD